MPDQRFVPATVHVERQGSEAFVRPEPPVPGSNVFTRLDRLVAKHCPGLDRVVIDGRPFQRSQGRGLDVLVTVITAFRSAGIAELALTSGRYSTDAVALLDELGVTIEGGLTQAA